MVKIKESPSQTRFGGFPLPISAYFIFGKPTRKQQTMVKLHLAANAIAKSRSQIKPKLVKAHLSTQFLSFLWRVHQGAGASLSHTRGMWKQSRC